MKQELKELRGTLPITDAQIKEAARLIGLLIVGLFFLFGMLQAFTGDASAQSVTKSVLINVNDTDLQPGEATRAVVWCLDGEGANCTFQNSESDPPEISIVASISTAPEQTDFYCWDFFEHEWEFLGHRGLGFGPNCSPDMQMQNASDTNTDPVVFAHEFQAPFALERNSTVTRNVTVFAHNAEVESELGGISNVVRSGQDQLQLDRASDEEQEAAFFTASAFQFSGWDESNVVFLLTVLALLTFSAYHGLVGCVFACVITVPVPIWNELASNAFPWGFAAFALLYTLMIVIHVGYEAMGGLRSTSRRGGMF